MLVPFWWVFLFDIWSVNGFPPTRRTCGSHSNLGWRMETWQRELDLLGSPRKLLLLHGWYLTSPCKCCWQHWFIKWGPLVNVIERYSPSKDTPPGPDTMENDCWRLFSFTASQTLQCQSWTCSRTAATTGALPATSPTTSTILFTPHLPLLRSDTDVILLQAYHRNPFQLIPFYSRFTLGWDSSFSVSWVTLPATYSSGNTHIVRRPLKEAFLALKIVILD